MANANEIIYVSATSLGHPNVVVQTTPGKLAEYIGVFEMKSKETVTAELAILTQSLHVDISIDDMFTAQGKRWEDFCNDIVLYYTARFVLSGEPIPRMTAEGMLRINQEYTVCRSECQVCKSIHNLLRCKRCKRVYYCSKECQRSDWPAHRNNCIDSVTQNEKLNKSTNSERA